MILVLLTAFVAACGPAKQQDGSMETSADNQKGIPFEVLVQHSHGGYDQPQIKVEMIIGLYMGEKNTGGFSIGIENIEETKKELIITVKETSPDANSMVVTAICQPFCIVKMPATKKDVVFKKVG